MEQGTPKNNRQDLKIVLNAKLGDTCIFLKPLLGTQMLNCKGRLSTLKFLIILPQKNYTLRADSKKASADFDSIYVLKTFHVV